MTIHFIFCSFFHPNHHNSVLRNLKSVRRMPVFWAFPCMRLSTSPRNGLCCERLEALLTLLFRPVAHLNKLIQCPERLAGIDQFPRETNPVCHVICFSADIKSRARIHQHSIALMAFLTIQDIKQDFRIFFGRTSFQILFPATFKPELFGCKRAKRITILLI